MSPIDGDGSKLPVDEEAHERLWRSDPADGLRPIMAQRSLLAEASIGQESAA